MAVIVASMSLQTLITIRRIFNVNNVCNKNVFESKKHKLLGLKNYLKSEEMLCRYPIGD